MSTIEEQLAASLTGRTVARYDLPSEAQLNAVHAQLARGCREQRRFILFQTEGAENDCAVDDSAD